MDDGSIDFKKAVAAEIASTPIEALNPAQAHLFAADAFWPIFDRLRNEALSHVQAIFQLQPELERLGRQRGL